MSKGVAYALAILMLAANPAQADTSKVDVRANIKGACRIERVQPVDFGELVPRAAAADRTASGTVRYWCTKGVAYAITVGSGGHHSGSRHRMAGDTLANEAELLSYDLVARSPATGTGRGPNEPEALVLQGTVRTADYNYVSAGGFRDTVVITIAADSCCGSSGTIGVFAQSGTKGR